MTEAACREIVRKISNGDISSRSRLEKEKISVAKKYGISRLIKNAEIMEFADSERVREFLSIKPVRTASGVANVAVMWASDIPAGNGRFFSCPSKCIYCPQGRNAPKSYTGVEPTTLRAKRNNYDPYEQVKDRVSQFHAIGHPTDKCELIIMGGTFMAMPRSFRENFIKRCYDAFNSCESGSLEEAVKTNETATNRCVGLTIETMSTFCAPHHIDQMLSAGCTRVEIGVQTTSDRILDAIKRGHNAQSNKDAFARLRRAGLKITAHWMPGLTGLFRLDLDEEVRLFRRLFENPDYRPDELKIYPTLVMPGTELHDLWQRGEYEPLSDQGMELLVRLKKHVPEYVRIKRIMRDISEHEVDSGLATTNTRQLLHERGVSCRCIRCREVGLSSKEPENVQFVSRQYEASGGTEHFLSYESSNGLILAFLRLRLGEKARVRELHVYGQLAPIGSRGRVQHRGLGRALMSKAEKLAAERGFGEISVTSGVGVRGYYEKLNYSLRGPYMAKDL